MTTLTLTPKTQDDEVVYSDGDTSNQITLNVQKNNAPLASTPLTGKVLYPGGSPAGRVSSGSTDANGDIVLTMALTPRSFSKQALILTLFEDGQDYGTATLSSFVLAPISFLNAPPIAHSATPVIVTATIANALSGTAQGGIPLTWHIDNAQLNILDVPQMTDENNPATFKYFLRTLTDAEIKTLSANQIDLRLFIGPVAGGFSVPAPIPIAPALLAPETMGVPGSPPLIDDGIIAACAPGIPFYIRTIANASAGDYVSLLASPDSSLGQVMPMFGRQLDQATASGPFLMLVPGTNPVFETNGPAYIFYQIIRSKLGNAISRSDPLHVQIERQKIPTPPDGEPDPGLTDPQVSPVVYTVNNYANNDFLTVTIDFNGAYIPDIGDQVTPYIYLVGYTLANLNWVRKLPGPTYTLSKADFDARGAFVPFSHPYAAGVLKNIDGSYGQAYFTVQRGAQKKRSPSRPIVVDTMPAYSSGATATRP